jgi:hypothetical protein
MADDPTQYRRQVPLIAGEKRALRVRLHAALAGAR